MPFKCISFIRNRLKDLKKFVLPLYRSASQSQVTFYDFVLSLKQPLPDIISQNHGQKLKKWESINAGVPEELVLGPLFFCYLY